jgi:hypothetical protein
VATPANVTSAIITNPVLSAISVISPPPSKVYSPDMSDFIV